MSHYSEDSQKDDSKMSFFTVTSMIEGFNEENFVFKKDSIVDKTNIDKNKNLNGNLMQSEIKESFEDMPLQISKVNKVKNKEILPYLIVDYKGEKKD